MRMRRRLAHAARLWAGSHDETWDGLKKRFTAIFESEGFVRSCPEGSALLQLFSCHFIGGSEAADIEYVLHERCQRVAPLRHKCPPPRGSGAKRPRWQRLGHFARWPSHAARGRGPANLSHPGWDVMAQGWPPGHRAPAIRWPGGRGSARAGEGGAAAAIRGLSRSPATREVSALRGSGTSRAGS